MNISDSLVLDNRGEVNIENSDGPGISGAGGIIRLPRNGKSCMISPFSERHIGGKYNDQQSYIGGTTGR